MEKKEIPLYERVDLSIKSYIREGALASIRSGLTSSYLAPFALALDAGAGFLGMLSSFPELVGSIFQLNVNFLRRKFTRKQIIMGCALVEALVWLPILLIPFIGASLWLLLLLVTLKITMQLISEPVYNSLIADLVASNDRTKVFGKRNKIVGILSFIAMLFAGFILNRFTESKFLGFAIVFMLALIVRLMSIRHLAKLYEPQGQKKEQPHVSFRKFIYNLGKNNFGTFTLYLSLFKFSVAIAAPFFSMYMLRSLGLNYFEFTLVNIASVLSSFIFLDLWSWLIDRRGSKSILKFTGVLIPAIPFLWIVFKETHQLIIIEIVSGMLWAGFNLATSCFIFDATMKEERMMQNSYFNFIKGLSTFIGAVLGGLLVGILPDSIFGSQFLVLFFISGVLRMLANFLLVFRLKEDRLIKVQVGKPLHKRFLAIKPSEGVVFQVIDRNGNTHMDYYKRD